MVLGYSTNPDLCLMNHSAFFFPTVKAGCKIIANTGNAELMLLKAAAFSINQKRKLKCASEEGKNKIEKQADDRKEWEGKWSQNKTDLRKSWQWKEEIK